MGEYSLGDAIQQFLKKSRLKGSVQALQIADVWEQIMGKTVAKYTESIKIYGDKLYVTTSMAPLKQELMFQKEKIIERVNEALGEIWAWITELDKIINIDKPWTMQGDDLHTKLEAYINDYIVKIATALQPFLPEVAKKILDQFTGPTIKTSLPLFPRII